MSSISGPTVRGAGLTSDPTIDAALEFLTDRQRAVLGVVLERPTLTDERDVATRLVAGRADADPSELGRETIRRVHAELRHRHLPALEEAGVIEWHRAEATVEPTAHPLVADPWFRRLVETDAELDGLVECLGTERCRLVLTALDEFDAPVEVEELARTVHANEHARPEASVREVAVALHHVHLPRLEDAGLVERRDDGDDHVVARSRSGLELEWFKVLLHT